MQTNFAFKAEGGGQQQYLYFLDRANPDRGNSYSRLSPVPVRHPHTKSRLSGLHYDSPYHNESQRSDLQTSIHNADFAIEVKMAPTPRELIPLEENPKCTLKGVKAKIERSLSQVSRQKSKMRDRIGVGVGIGGNADTLG